MDYVLSFISVLVIGITFTLNKYYQVNGVKRFSHVLIYPIVFDLISAFIFLCLTVFTVEFKWFSIATAFVCGFGVVAYTVCSLIAVKYGKVVVFTMFLMIGGMLLPYLYGIFFLHEELTVCRIIGMIVMIGALIFNSLVTGEKREERPKLLFWILCIASFFLNGINSISAKVHQISEQAVSTSDFAFWQHFLKALLAGIALLIYLCFIEKKGNGNNTELKPDGEELKLNKKLILSIALVSAISSAGGTLCMLTATKTLPATALYPIVTGGTTIITAIMARIFFKEKITKPCALSLVIILIGTVLFMF